MKSIIRTIIYVSILLLTESCSDNKRQSVFYEVAHSYNNDSLKFKASLFLAKNSDYHYGYIRELVYSTGNTTKINYKEFKTDTLFMKYLLEHGFRYNCSNKIWDKDTITGEFLKENIELAFDSWKKPWSKDVPFSDFCKYILPYRNADEQLSNWRRRFKEKYEATIADSVKDVSNIRKVALYLMRRVKEEIKYGTRMGIVYEQNFLSPDEMERMHTLECRALAHYGTLVLRACGVPCSTIETHWRFTEVVHTSILIPKTGTNHRACRLSVYDELQEMREEKDSMASWRTWSYEYEPNQELLSMSLEPDIPTYFTEPLNRIDITKKFSHTHSISCNVPKHLQNFKYLFLCRFNKNEWYPIREGFVKGDSVFFKDATIRQLYRLGYFKNGTLNTFGEVFTILGNGEKRAYNCIGDTVMFKLVFNCEPYENRTERELTVYRWGNNKEKQDYNGLVPTKGVGILWGFNEKNGEYKIFKEHMRKDFKPVFHLMTVDLPQWTAFTHEELPRPIGFISKDSITNEGYTMQF